MPEHILNISVLIGLWIIHFLYYEGKTSLKINFKETWDQMVPDINTYEEWPLRKVLIERNLIPHILKEENEYFKN